MDLSVVLGRRTFESHCRGRGPRSVVRSKPIDACRGTRGATPSFARASAPPRASFPSGPQSCDARVGRRLVSRA